MQFHEDHSASLTICVNERITQLQYGVVQTNNLTVTKIEEKPFLKHNVNAGIYVVSQKLLDLVPQDSFFDMPQLIDMAIGKKAILLHSQFMSIG